jgi:CO dehydrogenase/acetyl-CoA synthase beta subunit
LVKLCQIIHAYIKTVVPQVEAIEFRWILGSKEVGGMGLIEPLYRLGIQRLKAQEIALTMEDEDVDIFYGCTICKSLAPNHVCVITPSQIPYCGIPGEASVQGLFERADIVPRLPPTEK